ncbi:MAG: GAF domain-containing protein [Anaerolineae bacterium]|nr:GAF domain-containing protein [Anaerolineae bacterium]MBT4312246.1 GAF domain-containing protein [Anaerolineae bacterium]MBT6060425.1 GAF domain-containing protein [Anaerolineae bacterium]MBT6813322.1 GAF domain-containing protein [Anaerolineae bacterium]MBT7016027.1 GAF domain-containing protein [Anaerolineae bacterium]
MLKLIIQTAADVLGCEAASILLYDEKTQNLFFAAATGENAKKLAEIPVPINDSLAGTIFSTRQPLILNQIENDPRHNLEASEHVGFQTRSLLGVPLRIRDKTIGVLESLNKRKGPFIEADKNILTVLASHAAVAIHNAQLVQALQQAYEDVSKADKLKSNFLALASHELRTPLGIIIGYSTFLREESDSEASNHAEQVLNAALQMRTLLEDMNNLTMLETKTSLIIARKAILQDVLGKATEEIKELAQAKGQKVLYKFQEEPLEIMVDVKKLSAAIVNLLHNAVRFSPENAKIILGVKREENRILCWIKDSGIGIPKDQLENIFEKFYQVEAPNIRRYGGMGIGLTIAQGLVESQGGKLWAESDGEGLGATFKISLPIRKKL